MHYTSSYIFDPDQNMSATSFVLTCSNSVYSFLLNQTYGRSEYIFANYGVTREQVMLTMLH